MRGDTKLIPIEEAEETNFNKGTSRLTGEQLIIFTDTGRVIKGLPKMTSRQRQELLSKCRIK